MIKTRNHVRDYAELGELDLQEEFPGVRIHGTEHEYVTSGPDAMGRTIKRLTACTNPGTYAILIEQDYRTVWYIRENYSV